MVLLLLAHKFGDCFRLFALGPFGSDILNLPGVKSHSPLCTGLMTSLTCFVLAKPQKAAVSYSLIPPVARSLCLASSRSQDPLHHLEGLRHGQSARVERLYFNHHFEELAEHNRRNHLNPVNKFQAHLSGLFVKT